MAGQENLLKLPQLAAVWVSLGNSSFSPHVVLFHCVAINMKI